MKKRHGILFKISLTAGILFLTLALSAAALLEPGFKIYGWESLDESKLTRSEKAVTFLDSEGRLIENTVYDANRSYVRYEDIQSHTIDAFVSIEDKRFFKHNGVDYIRICGALIDNIKSFSFKEGASTISQQLIKNTHLTSEKKIGRKIKEIRIARELERKFSKSEILEMYLNMLYFGDNMYGITTASKVFFGVEPTLLSLSQSALLAGVINNPSKFNPYRNPENALARRNEVLKAMLNNGKLDAVTYEAAKNEPLGVSRDNAAVCHYLNSVILDACDILGIGKRNLLSRNLTIATHYVRQLDDDVQGIIKNAELPEGANARIVVTKNGGGKVISDVGRKDDNISDLRRQPGSTIKPLISYAPALEKGEIYCCSHIMDEPTDFGGYAPSNYKDKYCGWVKAEDALARSLNVPAVKLLYRVGVEYGKQTAEKMGLTFDEADKNLALALGGMTNGVTLRELTDAYGTLAVGGRRVNGQTVRYIADENGEVIYSGGGENKKRAISEDTAFLVGSMLRKCVTDGTAKQLSEFDNVCAKTGTVGNSEGNTDVYCIAYTPRFTVGVWVGGQRMSNSVTSSGLACSLAESILTRLGDKSSFVRPKSVKCRYIDTEVLNGSHEVVLAGEDIPLKDKSCEWFSERYLPTKYSTLQNGGYFYYDDLLNLDFDNFDVIDGFFD